MHNPVATYRIQFHTDFTFEHLARIIPYLKQLGITTLYASPVFESTPGSTHGYDGVNPNGINPEIGSEEQLKAVSRQLQAEGIQWLQDIVPNHMAFHPRNRWLMDVLEKGRYSPFQAFFDIDWKSDLYNGRIMVPFLGASLDQVIQHGELKVAYQDQRLVLAYYDSAYPFHLRSYITVLQACSNSVPQEITPLLQQMEALEAAPKGEDYAVQADGIRMQFATLLEKGGDFIHLCLKNTNDNPEKLQHVAQEQEYVLCHWQETDRQINFRRFFTVNGLISLNIHDPEVFRHVHQLAGQLVGEGVFQGLRVDHIDGLYDPAGYLEQLRELAGKDTYIVVEKILEPGEDLPREWPIEGNTGYDFLGMVNNLLTRGTNEEKFTRFYEKLADDSTSIHQQLHDKKSHILSGHMQGELDNLLRLFLDQHLAEETTLSPDDHMILKQAIGEFLIQCPVYRYYGNRLPLRNKEAGAIADIFKRIRKGNAGLAPGVKLLEAAILEKPGEGNESYNARALHFYQRCMQFTGPLMAKGVEDTLMYTYNRFIGHNEVGDSPEAFGTSIARFHDNMTERQQHWPLSINSTSTHDTKRGEDVRARLNVLTSMPGAWTETVEKWQQMNADLRHGNIPDANDEYFIYQTLCGSYPMPGQPDDDFSNRLKEYLVKASREAKRHSNWTTPKVQYEEGVSHFVTELLKPERTFLSSFLEFQHQVADFGIIHSLVQVVLRFACPGVPDTYQGTELWDLSFVDPDNRRAVDYEQRIQWLEELTCLQEQTPEALAGMLWNNRYDARIKLWLVHVLMNQRKLHPDLFEKGEYLPLHVKGTYKDHILAFARRYRDEWMVVAVPLYLPEIAKQKKKGLTVNWKDTDIVLPPEAPLTWKHLLSSQKGGHNHSIAVSDVLNEHLPVAVLTLQHPVTERGAGILLHITSLPSKFGVGDFGPEARKFARFLSRSRQKFWQLLPLSATGSSEGYSPYSAYSSTAGNTLLISPELLVEEGLLGGEALKHYHLPSGDRVDFEAAEKAKLQLFDQAYRNYLEHQNSAMMRQFDEFCRREADWLDDFAMYSVLKQRFDHKAWFQWPMAFRLRKQEALHQFTQENESALEKVKWLQFIFTRQWSGLKSYCNTLGIQLYGDLPFYVGYDSVDVWSHPDIFNIDEEGNILGVAGVPPDYFNANGQLWGMPVFKWDVLKEQGYAWWKQRISKNMELYDLLRLDHFRAFAEYWEVPAGEDTAINGRWMPGPGSDFFTVMLKELGSLPFVAEDLGDIDDKVYQLRDAFNLPGMKVLQFAFGNETSGSLYIPHNYTPNYIVYTGTHDNNTTRGWYVKDAGKEARKQVSLFAGTAVTEKDVHTALAKMAYASVARTVILPMQDVLGLDETARMNTPASIENNWLWSLRQDDLNDDHDKQLRKLVQLFNR